MNQRPSRELIEEVALAKGISESFVEKDWFVTQIISVIAGVQHPNFEVIFTGGTALSKAHKLLQRFSEDVDFRVRVLGQLPNRKACSDFKQVVAKSLRDYGFVVDDAQIQARDSNRFFSIELDYESYFPAASALRPHIQIEVTIKNPQLAPLYLPVSSFVSELTQQSPEVTSIGCIDPVESAIDKISAIAWRIPDRVRGSQDDDPTLVRHLHDLAILSSLAKNSPRFSALARDSISQDANRARNDLSIVELSSEDRLERMLYLLENEVSYAQEYKQFVDGVSYAADGSTPNFANAIQAVRELAHLIILIK